MRRYRAVKKLGDDYEDTALDAIQNPKLAAFDEKSSALLLTVDSLGRVPEGTEPDCAKLAQLKSAAAEMIQIGLSHLAARAVMDANEQYLCRIH